MPRRNPQNRNASSRRLAGQQIVAALKKRWAAKRAAAAEPEKPARISCTRTDIGESGQGWRGVGILLVLTGACMFGRRYWRAAASCWDTILIICMRGAWHSRKARCSVRGMLWPGLVSARWGHRSTQPFRVFLRFPPGLCWLLGPLGQALVPVSQKVRPLGRVHCSPLPQNSSWSPAAPRRSRAPRSVHSDDARRLGDAQQLFSRWPVHPAAGSLRQATRLKNHEWCAAPVPGCASPSWSRIASRTPFLRAPDASSATVTGVRRVATRPDRPQSQHQPLPRNSRGFRRKIRFAGRHHGESGAARMAVRSRGMATRWARQAPADGE